MTIEQFRETLMAVAISPEYLEIITKKRRHMVYVEGWIFFFQSVMRQK